MVDGFLSDGVLSVLLVALMRGLSLPFFEFLLVDVVLAGVLLLTSVSAP